MHHRGRGVRTFGLSLALLVILAGIAAATDYTPYSTCTLEQVLRPILYQGKSASDAVIQKCWDACPRGPGVMRCVAGLDQEQIEAYLETYRIQCDYLSVYLSDETNARALLAAHPDFYASDLLQSELEVSWGLQHAMSSEDPDDAIRFAIIWNFYPHDLEKYGIHVPEAFYQKYLGSMHEGYYSVDSVVADNGAHGGNAIKGHADWIVNTYLPEYNKCRAEVNEELEALEALKYKHETSPAPAPAPPPGPAPSAPTQKLSQTQALAAFRQQLKTVLADWENQAASLPPKKPVDPLGKLISPETLKQGVGPSLPVVTLQFDVKNAKAGEAVSATLPDGMTVSKIIAVPSRPIGEATTTITVADGKTWLLAEQAKGKPDYPLPDEEIDKIIRVDTVENGHKTEDAYRQAMIEYTMPMGTFAYGESDAKASPDALKAQQDFFRSLETISNAKQYRFPGAYTDQESFLGRMWDAMDAEENRMNMRDAKGFIFVRYDEAKKSFTQLPNKRVWCGDGVCHYVAISPGTSTFAILWKPRPFFSPGEWFIMAFLIIDILVITFVRKWLERAAARKKDASGRKGLASLILGIAGLLLFVVPYVGLLLSGLALVYARAQKTAKPTKPATAGYILGIIGVSLNVLLLAFVLFVVLR